MLFRSHSQSNILRMGISSLFDTRSKEYSYSYVSQDTARHSYSYNYVRKDKFFSINCFGGFQIGKRYRNAYLYEATDFSFKYKWESIDPYPIYLNFENMRPNETAQIAILKNNKTMVMGIKQSLGFQYFITSYFSLSVEGGLILDWDRVNNQDSFISISSYDGTFAFGGSSGFDKPVTWNFQGKISPLTFLFLNYHF